MEGRRRSGDADEVSFSGVHVYIHGAVCMLYVPLPQEFAQRRGGGWHSEPIYETCVEGRRGTGDANEVSFLGVHMYINGAVCMHYDRVL